MNLNENTSKILKDIFAGRKIKIIDNIIFSLSGKKANGWSIGNKLRNLLYGKREYISQEKILFIGGSPRGGTNLLQSLIRTFDGVGGIWPEVCLFQDIKEEEFLREFGLNENEIIKVKKDFGTDIIKLSEIIIKEYKRKNNISLITLNAPKQGVFIDELFRYFPNSKFIFMIRDGRDVAISMKGYHGFSIEQGAKIWAVSMNSRRKVRNNKNYLEIKYENLIKSPLNEMSKISEFLSIKLPPKNKILNFFTKAKPEELKKLSSLHEKQLSKPIYNTSIGRWKKEMSNKEKKIFKNFAGEILIREDYEKDNNW